MIEKENFPMEDDNLQGQDDESSNNVNFTERTLPGTPGDPGPVGANSPLTKNLLGDNPPRSEQAAFEAGNAGDMTSNEAKYQDSEIEQNFRENIEKAKEEIALDKKLKGGA